MIDHRLRPLAESWLTPLVEGPIRRVSPTTLSVTGLAVGIGAAGAAAASLWPIALVLWLANRLLDGLDGAVARRTNDTSAAGGYLDLCCDIVVYALVPLGVAVGVGDESTWIAAAVLLGAFYVNITTVLALSAAAAHRLGERRAAFALPLGLVEGTETIVWFSLLLALPGLAPWWMGSMGVAVTVGAALRIRHGLTLLRSEAPS